MDGDAVRPGLFADHRGRNNARLRRAPRLPHSRDVIDVDVESCAHLSFRTKALPDRPTPTGLPGWDPGGRANAPLRVMLGCPPSRVNHWQLLIDQSRRARRANSFAVKAASVSAPDAAHFINHAKAVAQNGHL